MVQLAQYVYFIKTGHLGGAERDAIFLDHRTRIAFLFFILEHRFRSVPACFARGSLRFQQLELGKGGVCVWGGGWDISQGHTLGNSTE